MHRVILALMVLPSIAVPATAAPFMPNRFDLAITGAWFALSGTETLCFRCEDADITNDVVITYVGGGGSGLLGNRTGFVPSGGLQVAGSLPIPEFNSTFTLDVMLTLFDDVNYPGQSSISFGQFGGGFLQGSSREPSSVFMLCCGGTINGVSFSNATLFWRPPGLYVGLNTVRPPLLEVFPPSGSVFTPAPEPASVLLLGSGIFVSAVRHGFRRRRR